MIYLRRYWYIALAVVFVFVAGVGFYALRSNEAPAAFPSLPGSSSKGAASSPARPLAVHKGPLNLLLLGSDSRDPRASSNKPSRWRADTIVLVHIPPQHDKALFVSLPRDLWVNVPGRGMAKLNAAYSWGGQSLIRRTVEAYTGVKITYTGVIDFSGLQATVNGLGGIDMPIEKTIRSIHPPYRVFNKGTQHLNGAQALDYIRQRYQFPRGDFDRIRHQQQFLRAMLTKAVTGGVLVKMARMQVYLNSTRYAIDWYPRVRSLDLAWQFRSLRADDLVFTTTPHDGAQSVSGQSVVVPNRAKARSLYGKIRGSQYF